MDIENEYSSGVMEFTPGQILAGKIIAIASVVALLAFYVLVYFGVIAIDFWSNFVGAMLCCIGIILLLSGLVQRNSVSIFLAFPFLVPGILAILCENSIAQYWYLYPLYIAIPAISSFFTMLVCGGYKTHLKVIAVFVVEALFYVLNIVGVMAMPLSIVLSIVWALIVFAYIIYKITRSVNNG